MTIRNNMADSNLIVIKGSFNKTPGQVYKIAPCPDPSGRMAKCVRKVDANGDMILSDEDKTAQSNGTASRERLKPHLRRYKNHSPRISLGTDD